MFGAITSGAEHWETCPLDSIVSLTGGYAFKSSKYSERGTRIIRISNVQDGFIEDNSPAYYSESDMRGLGRYLLREGDMLMSLTGNVGRVGFLQKDLLPAALNQRVACLRKKRDTPDGRCVNMRYLYEYFRSSEFQRMAETNSSGVAQKNMSTRWLSSLAIALPPIRIQEQFADYASQVDKLRFDDLSRLFPPHSPPNRKPELRMTGCSGKKTCDELLSQRGQFNNSADSFFSCADLEKSKPYLADTIRSSRSYS